MVLVEDILVLTLVGSAIGVALVFLLYPLVVVLFSLATPEREDAPEVPAASRELAVSLLVAVRNAEGLIEEKVQNSLELVWPGPLQLVFVSDGSRDRTAERMRAAGGERIEVLEIVEHVGKAQALNRGADLCRGDVLVFSDADALLAPDALGALLAPYADARVGGVCGQRVIQEKHGDLTHAQGCYIAADSALKRAESRVGSVTSNDGKLYSIRRELFRPIAAGATDDLYTCLNVVEQGYRFVFEPRALAFIRTPSRSPSHELARRRRIVARSLRGIFLMRGLLNPLRYGSFSIQLLVNKIFRRLLPVFLGGLLLSSGLLGITYTWARALFFLQVLFFALALSHPFLGGRSRLRGATSLACYFCIGNLGTLLGLGDFLSRKETIKWDPIKAD